MQKRENFREHYKDSRKGRNKCKKGIRIGSGAVVMGDKTEG